MLSVPATHVAVPAPALKTPVPVVMSMLRIPLVNVYVSER